MDIIIKDVELKNGKYRIRAKEYGGFWEIDQNVAEELVQVKANPLQTDVMPEIAEWVKEKPKKPCLMVARTFYDRYNYELFELNYLDGYLAVICDDGEEWGDLEDLEADEYYVIEYFNSNLSV